MSLKLLPRRLRQRRRECGDLTLEQVSERTGLSVSFLSDIERGRSQPSLDTLEKLAECYQTNLAALFTEVDAQDYARQLRIRFLEEMRESIDVELKMLRGE